MAPSSSVKMKVILVLTYHFHVNTGARLPNAASARTAPYPH
ncbi:hypothetical protein [Acetobacter sp. DmW_136]|nr:hypothetical protein [Acetobacter sp. DmW_136]